MPAQRGSKRHGRPQLFFASRVKRCEKQPSFIDGVDSCSAEELSVRQYASSYFLLACFWSWHSLVAGVAAATLRVPRVRVGRAERAVAPAAREVALAVGRAAETS